MNKFTIFLILTGLIVLTRTAAAQGNQDGRMIQDRDRVQNPSISPSGVAGSGNQVQNQNQIQTQNQGEETQVRIMYQEQEAGSENQPQAEGAAWQHMSRVAQQVGELLADSDGFTGIGAQVRDIAQEQVNIQNRMRAELAQMEGRSGFLRRLIGPDYKAIKNLNQQIENNQMQIQFLEQLANQVQNQADETRIREMVAALNAQAAAVRDQIRDQERVGSVFGWLMKLLVK